MGTNKLIYAGGFSELEERFLYNIRKITDVEPFNPIYIIVSSNNLIRYLKGKITRDLNAILNIRFFTLKDMVKHLHSRTREDANKRLASILLMRLLLREIVERSEGDIRGVEDIDGLVKGLLNTLREIREGGLFKPDDYDYIVGTVVNRTDDSEKLVELMEIFKEYCEVLDRNDYMTLEDYFYETLNYLSEAVKDERIHLDMASGEGDEPRVLNSLNTGITSDSLIIYGFYDFNHLQRKVIEMLSEIFDIHFYFPIPLKSPGVVVDDCNFAHPTLDWLLVGGFTVERLDSSRKENSTLDLLKTSIFESSFKIKDHKNDDESLNILSCPNPRNEIEEIARRVLQFADEGIKLHNTAIVISGGDEQRDLVESVFGRYGIPYYSEGISLSRTSAGKTITFLIDTILTDFDREDFINLLKSLKDKIIEEFGIDKNQLIDRFRQLVYYLGIIGGSEEWMSSLKRFISREGLIEGDNREYLDLLQFSKYIYKMLSDIVERFPHPNNKDEMGEFNSVVQDIINRYFKVVDRKKVIDEIFETFEEVSSSVKKITFQEYLKLLQEEIVEKVVAKGRFQHDGVHIIDKNSIRGLRFDVVFLLGLQEGVFPKGVRQDPFILDYEREIINEEGEYGVVIKGESIGEDYLHFANIVLSTKSNLILSFSRFRTLSTKEFFPSHLILDTIYRLTGEMLDYEGLDADQELPFFKYIINKPYESYSLDINEYDIEKVGRLCENYGEKTAMNYLGSIVISPDFKKPLRSLKVKIPYNDDSSLWNIITDEELLRELNDRFSKGVHSATSIENYSVCPLKYFFKSFLRLKTIDPPKLYMGVEPMEKGIIIHQLYFQLFSQIREREDNFSISDIEKYLTEIDDLTNIIYQDVVGDVPEVYDPLKEVDIKNIAQLAKDGLKKEIDKYGEWNPKYFEASFGRVMGDGDILSEEPIEFILGEGDSLKLSGKVDRIDIMDKTVRVIDYKTGSVKDKISEVDDSFRRGELLQLPIYLSMFLQTGESEEIDEFIAQYFYIKKCRYIEIYEDFSIDDLQRDLMIILQRIVNSIKSGIFIFNPNNSCEYCDYSSICSPKFGYGEIGNIPGANPFYELNEGLIDDDEN